MTSAVAALQMIVSVEENQSSMLCRTAVRHRVKEPICRPQNDRQTNYVGSVKEPICRPQNDRQTNYVGSFQFKRYFKSGSWLPQRQCGPVRSLIERPFHNGKFSNFQTGLPEKQPYRE